MQQLRVAFSDAFRSFDAASCFWTRLLSRRFRVQLVDQDEAPEVLFFGDWGNRHWGFQGRKVYWSGENCLPDFDQCDFAMTSASLEDEPHHLRVPTWLQAIGDPSLLIRN